MPSMPACVLGYTSTGSREANRMHRPDGTSKDQSVHVGCIARGAKAFCFAALLLGLPVSALPQSGAYSDITGYPVTTANSEPRGITTGPDGALWFAEFAGNKIGRITTAGAITEYLMPTADSGPYESRWGPMARCGLPKTWA